MRWGDILKEILAVIGGVAAVVAAAAWFTKVLLSHVFSRNLEKHKADLTAAHMQASAILKAEHDKQLELLRAQCNRDLESFRSEVQRHSNAEERLRIEIIRWANPILGAVNALDARLANILDKTGYLALRKGFSHPQWSITSEYFFGSTLYLFAAYFAWISMLKETMSFELFTTQDEKTDFFEKIHAVTGALGAYPPKYSCAGRDVQVFSLQQQAIGEAIAHRSEQRPSCMTYDEFLVETKGPQLTERLAPLRALLEGVAPEDDCRWKRLQATREALRNLQTCCGNLLNLQRAVGSAPKGHRSIIPVTNDV